MRLDQCDVLLEWLINKHPEKAALKRALDTLQQVQSMVHQSLVAAESN